MEIMKIISTLQSVDMGYITYAPGDEFASAVEEAVALLIRQGEIIAEAEETAVRQQDRIDSLEQTVDYARTIDAENIQLKIQLEHMKEERDAVTKRLMELEAQTAQTEQTVDVPQLSEDEIRLKLYDILEDHCLLSQEECTNADAPDCIYCLADCLIKRGVTVKGEENGK